VIQAAPPPEKTGGDDGKGNGDDAATADRPPWHWVGFGTIATFALWLPLVYAAEAFRHHLFVSKFGANAAREDIEHAFAMMSGMERFRWTAMETVPHVLVFGLSAYAGGFLVGRWGNGTGPKEAALSGVVTALIADVLAWRVVAEGGWGGILSMAVPLLLAVLCAWLGGRQGAKKKKKI